MDNTIVVSTPPHVKSGRTTKSIMIDVLISLLPAVIAGIVLFGWYTLAIEVVSVAAAVAAEFVYYFIYNGGFAHKCKNAGAICRDWVRKFDFTSAVTGLILALIMPANADWTPLLYEVVIGDIFAIVIVKMLFGGTGKNLVNPAAAGRVLIFISFSITTFSAGIFEPISLDSNLFTGATHLSGYLLGGNAKAEIALIDLFVGTGVAGCIGETCKIALLIGYLYLVVRKVIKWWQPVLYIVVAAFLSTCLAAAGGTFDIALFPSFALSGGLMFGAIFMATDYVTSPKGVYGQIVYYVALGILTAVLRYFTKIEVVSFVIMIMNCLVPLIDIYIVRKPFGYSVKKEAEKK